MGNPIPQATMALNNDNPGTATTTVLKHQPPKMPNELWDKVFQNLPSADIKAVRLTWKAWKDLGARYLFQPFVFRRDRADFARFERVMSDPALSAGVTQLIFETGAINVIYFLIKLSRSYWRAYNEALKPGFESSDYLQRLEEVEMDHEAAIIEYAEWNNNCFDAGQNYGDVENLTSTLRKLQKLERIDITRKSIGFESELLFATWLKGCGNDGFKRATEELTALLEALGATKAPLKHFSHDKLPVTFFTQGPQTLEQLAEPFQYLQTLHLTFDATESPVVGFWKGLGHFLTSIPRLQDLRMGFIVPDTGVIESNNWKRTETVHLWYLPLWKLFGKYVWKDLKSLRLDGLVLCELGLKQMVEKHPTLETFELHNIGLWAGTFKGLLYSLRGMGFLKKFIASGHLRAFHTQYEAWNFHRGIDPHQEIWCENFCKLSEMNPGNYYESDIAQDKWDDHDVDSEKEDDETENESEEESDNIEDNSDNCRHCKRVQGCRYCEIARRLDAFVTKGGPWPMRRYHFSLRSVELPNRLDLHSVACKEFCRVDMDDIDHQWSEHAQDSLVDWEVSSPLRTVDAETEFDELYFHGEDMHGYSRDGYNDEGLHYLDAPVSDPEAPEGAISHVRAYRQILGSILNKITRDTEKDVS